MYLFYTLLVYAALPFVMLRLLWRSRKAPAYRERWRERRGWVRHRPAPGGIWVHAVSVGEVQAIAPLIRLLLERHPDKALTVTTTTPTGSDQVRRLFAEQVCHSYMPYDLPRFLGRFLDAVRPSHLLMVETEVWPNLLQACRQRGVQTLLANARLSERSLRGYQRLDGFARQVFSSIDQVAAQTEDDARRFRVLGAGRVEVTGSIKFDVDIPASVTEQVEVMRRSWGGRPVWVAASTHEGEDEIMLVAHARLLNALPEALLILVPRHPERFERVAGQIVRSGLQLARRSEGDLPGHDVQVYLGDTMGELPVLLGASDVAFFGGSLARVGGHNMLEAAAQGVPVCFGPHTFNFALISRMLLECGAALVVNDAEQLAEALRQWLGDASVRATAGEAGRHMVDRNRGALDRLYRLLQESLSQESGDQ
jgi:3-deoxy-D-manno-octulosonic-acid transferase